jgi:predicted kinase
MEKIAELENILNTAENISDDPDVKARVKFLKLGLETGKFSTGLYNARMKKDNKTYRELQKQYRALIQRLAFESPLALSPGGIGFRTRFVFR